MTATNRTLYFEGNLDTFDAQMDQVYPCQCGEVHRGTYGVHDYMHHTCLHEASLVYVIEPNEIPGDRGCQVMCGDCGKLWDVDAPK